MKENPCTEYTTEDIGQPHYARCRCPVCKGFLTPYFGEEPFKCKKCGTMLQAFQEIDGEDGSIIEGYGKICQISDKPQKKEKQSLG